MLQHLYPKHKSHFFDSEHVDIPPRHDINSSPCSNTCFNHHLGPPTGHDLIENWNLELNDTTLFMDLFGCMHVAGLPVDKED